MFQNQKQVQQNLGIKTQHNMYIGWESQPIYVNLK